MKNFLLLILLGAIIFTGCKKDSTSQTTISSPNGPLQAYINGTVWTPVQDSLNATINFNSTTRVKTFTFGGTRNYEQLSLTLTLSNETNSATVPLTTFAGDITTYFAVAQPNSTVYVPDGTLQDGSQSLTISAVDTVKKVMTGTFQFTVSHTNTDSNGNFVSIDIYAITSGEFTNLPYTYTHN